MLKIQYGAPIFLHIFNFNLKKTCLIKKMEFNIKQVQVAMILKLF